MTAKKTKAKKILIVDDDELSSSAFAARLERRGFEVKLVTNSKFANQTLENEKFDLILLDIVMPEVDGITLLKEIRTKFTADILPIIMVTALHDGSDILTSFENGASDYITKPVNVDAAVSRIRGLLSQVDLFFERAKKREIETINSMVVTYHHEINNPLAIAKGELQLLSKGDGNPNPQRLKKIFEALSRIEAILKQIKEISESSEVSYEMYENKTKMVKINKLK